MTYQKISKCYCEVLAIGQKYTKSDTFRYTEIIILLGMFCEK